MRLRFGLFAALAVVAAFPAWAAAQHAAVPKAGMYRTLGGGEAGGYFKVASGGTSISAGATAQSNFKCNKMNAMVAKPIPVKGGSFAFSGTLKAEPNVAITWTGTWTSASTVSGTVRLKSASCDSGLIHWKAKSSAF